MTLHLPFPRLLAPLTVVAAFAAPVFSSAEEKPSVSGGRMAAVLQPFVESHTLAGAVVLVANKDQVLDVEAAGYANIAAQKPMRTDSVFWIASQSKTITAAAVMMLVDEGRVKLDDPVEKYLPEFKGQMVIAETDNDHVLLKKPTHPITVRNVLSHTSGLPFTSPIEKPTLDLFPLACRVRSYAMLPLGFEPDSKDQYSNAGLNTAGRIVEVVSRMPFEKFLNERLFEPLGMKETTFWPSGDELKRLAKSYEPGPGGLKECPIAQLSYPLDDARRQPMPAGGLFSTAADLARFYLMLANDGTHGNQRVLSDRAVREMETPQPGSPNYGLGMRINGSHVGHSGAYGTNSSLDRKTGLITIFLVQHAAWPKGGEKILGVFEKAAQGAFQTKNEIQARLDALLAQMTLAEKIGQMTQVDMLAIKDKADIAKYALGSMLSGGNSDPPDITARGWAAACDEYQAWALKTRLKIPLMYGIDAVHGHNNVDGAVIFPHNIGLGATRDPDLVRRAQRVTAEEVAGTGIQWVFAPCIAVPRDPRWGRTYEGFGETPELVSEMGAASIRGFQGSDLAEPGSVLACAKHFLGDGGTFGGKDQGDDHCDEAELRTIHLSGYKAAIAAGARSIMVSYSSVRGQKMHANRHLLSDVLKGELGFQGLLVSDWAAIDQISPDYSRDVETSINAGLDMIMIPNGPGAKNNYVDFQDALTRLVREGKVPMSRIDDAVARILRVKFAMGLFDRPWSNPALLAKVGSSEHREVARQCVRKSLVLLKNENRVLPLSKHIQRLLVAGRGADNLGMQCGGWTNDWQGRSGTPVHGGTTLLAAVKQAVSRDTKVSFSADGSGAEGAEAAIVVIGEMPYAETPGDRQDLGLAPEDVAAVERVKQAGTPVVTVLFSGRPLLIEPVLANSSALIAAWLPGTEGQGMTDVLFGDCKPAGKLPRTWPRSMKQITLHVGDQPYDPLFPYGFGLTY
jgi:beta-glucosidase